MEFIKKIFSSSDDACQEKACLEDIEIVRYSKVYSPPVAFFNVKGYEQHLPISPVPFLVMPTFKDIDLGGFKAKERRWKDKAFLFTTSDPFHAIFSLWDGQRWSYDLPFFFSQCFIKPKSLTSLNIEDIAQYLLDRKAKKPFEVKKLSLSPSQVGPWKTSLPFEFTDWVRKNGISREGSIIYLGGTDEGLPIPLCIHREIEGIYRFNAFTNKDQSAVIIPSFDPTYERFYFSYFVLDKEKGRVNAVDAEIQAKNTLKNLTLADFIEKSVALIRQRQAKEGSKK